MDLFDYMREQKGDKESPLASRLRPTTLDEVVGQQHIIRLSPPLEKKTSLVINPENIKLSARLETLLFSQTIFTPMRVKQMRSSNI